MVDDKISNGKRRITSRTLFKALIWVTALSYLAFWVWGLLLGYYFFGGPDPCKGWRPGMTKEEKILMVAKFANNLTMISFDMKRPETGEEFRGSTFQIPYNDIQKVLKDQPNCCHVYSSSTALSNNPQELNSALGGDEGTVLLRYLGKRLNRNTGEVKIDPIFNYLDLNTCKR